MYEWIISLTGSVAAVGAFLYAAKSFKRLRRSEQVRLSESVLTDLRNSIREYNTLNSQLGANRDKDSLREHLRRLDLYLRQTCETLNWYCILVEIGEITDQHLLDYFKRTIIRWHDDFFVKHVGIEIISRDDYPNFKNLYLRFKKEEQQKISKGSINTSKYFNSPPL